MSPHILHWIEQLEERRAPAAVFHYTDVDGDSVTLRISEGSASDVELVFDASGHQLEELRLHAAIFKGADVSLTAKRADGPGDGRMNLGFLWATPGLGDVLGGAGFRAGAIFAWDIGAVWIGGSVRAGLGDAGGMIASQAGIGHVFIGGDLAGLESDRARVVADESIKSVTIAGSVSWAEILAGMQSPDAQFGELKVGGDWVASSVASGVNPGADRMYGTNDDLKIASGDDRPAILSSIARVVIGGAIDGSLANDDAFGFVAEHIGVVFLGGSQLPLNAGPHNDLRAIGTIGDSVVLEI